MKITRAALTSEGNGPSVATASSGIVYADFIDPLRGLGQGQEGGNETVPARGGTGS
ncbi:MAG: hypothetical protein M5U22_08530 [Thermoleophilia bacterium]|nr:hypothetical protein [Thermoleophilia bacterium]